MHEIKIAPRTTAHAHLELLNEIRPANPGDLYNPVIDQLPAKSTMKIAMHAGMKDMQPVIENAHNIDEQYHVGHSSFNILINFHSI